MKIIQIITPDRWSGRNPLQNQQLLATRDSDIDPEMVTDGHVIQCKKNPLARS